MKKNKVIKLLPVILLIFILVFLVMPNKGKYVFTGSKIIADVESKETEVKDRTVKDYRIEYDNNDIVGLLSIDNTDYQTLVTQSSDNNYYLRRDVNKKYSRGGTPFLDYRVNIDRSKKILIYGHNSKYVDMPFKILENYYDKDYYNKHKYITLKTVKDEYKYEIFSVYVEPEDWSYLQVEFKNDEEYLSHLKMLKNNSMYDTKVEVSSSDKILILQTCSTKKEYKKYKKKFLLIIARKVEV